MKRKAQMQMMETFMVLLVFFILLAIGIYYYFQFSAKNIEETGQEVAILSGTTLLSVVSSMPELQCSIRAREEGGCLDAAKMTIAVEKGLFSTEDYKPLFDKKRVYVNTTYPKEAFISNKCLDNLAYKTPGCGLWILKDYQFKKGKRAVSTPVSIYYPDKGQFMAGKLVIEVSS